MEQITQAVTETPNPKHLKLWIGIGASVAVVLIALIFVSESTLFKGATPSKGIVSDSQPIATQDLATSQFRDTSTASPITADISKQVPQSSGQITGSPSTTNTLTEGSGYRATSTTSSSDAVVIADAGLPGDLATGKGIVDSSDLSSSYQLTIQKRVCAGSFKVWDNVANVCTQTCLNGYKPQEAMALGAPITCVPNTTIEPVLVATIATCSISRYTDLSCPGLKPCRYFSTLNCEDNTTFAQTISLYKNSCETAQHYVWENDACNITKCADGYNLKQSATPGAQSTCVLNSTTTIINANPLPLCRLADFGGLPTGTCLAAAPCSYVGVCYTETALNSKLLADKNKCENQLHKKWDSTNLKCSINCQDNYTKNTLGECSPNRPISGITDCGIGFTPSPDGTMCVVKVFTRDSECASAYPTKPYVWKGECIGKNDYCRYTNNANTSICPKTPADDFVEQGNGETPPTGGTGVAGAGSTPPADNSAALAALRDRNAALEYTISSLNRELESAYSAGNSTRIAELLASIANARQEQSDIIININTPAPATTSAQSNLVSSATVGGGVGGSSPAANTSSSTTTKAQPKKALLPKSPATQTSSDVAAAIDFANRDFPETASTPNKTRGSYIQGNTGPGILLYPIFMAAANGLYYVSRKRRK